MTHKWYYKSVAVGTSFQTPELTMNSVPENTHTLTLFSIHYMTTLKIPEFMKVFSCGDDILAISNPFVRMSNNNGIVGGTLGTKLYILIFNRI